MISETREEKRACQEERGPGEAANVVPLQVKGARKQQDGQEQGQQQLRRDVLRRVTPLVSQWRLRGRDNNCKHFKQLPQAGQCIKDGQILFSRILEVKPSSHVNCNTPFQPPTFEYVIWWNYFQKLLEGTSQARIPTPSSFQFAANVSSQIPSATPQSCRFGGQLFKCCCKLCY